VERQFQQRQKKNGLGNAMLLQFVITKIIQQFNYLTKAWNIQMIFISLPKKI
jgi:hypothetical protein